jgi:hypothetical protein
MIAAGEALDGGDKNCALCYDNQGFCDNCPLYKHLGEQCDEDGELYAEWHWKTFRNDDGYRHPNTSSVGIDFICHKIAQEMVELLGKVKEEIDG